MTALQLPYSAAPSGSAVWRGDGFDIGGHVLPVLAYEVSPSGWTDELTSLHEETGGSDHFIDVASRRYAIAEVLRSVPSPASTVLEVGCSSGFLLRELRERLPESIVIGADYTLGTLEQLWRRLPNVPLVQFDLTRCPLPSDFADATVALNVLEHISDDEAAMRHLFRITRPGGTAIIEVPAGSTLFDVYDRVLMHERRYDMNSLVALAERAGFIVERRSHLGAFLYPAFLLSKRLNQQRHKPDSQVDEKAVVASMIRTTRNSSPLLGMLMRLEDALRPYVYYPRGIRCLVTCRKP